MTRRSILLGGLIAVVLRAGVAVAAPPAALVEQATSDPAGAWERFLAEADLATSYPSLHVLDDVGYGNGGVDADKCRVHADALAEAVARLPVSVAVRHAAMLCADAAGTPEVAERELAAVAALSRLALAGAGEGARGVPVRILAPADIYALLRASGLEFRYEYYEELFPERYFPVHVVAWDPAAGNERHLRFDFVDAANAITREESHSEFPIQRTMLAEQFIESLVKAGQLSAADYRAVAQARNTGEPQAKLDVLAPAARRGGVQSATNWLFLCARRTLDGCGEGLVDALLPHAEAKHGMATVLLALAHSEGIGVEADARMAERLLDAADARWPRMGATEAYAALWVALRDAPIPAALQARLDRAWEAGNAEARLIALERAAQPEGAVLDEAALADLASPAFNDLGRGFAVLAKYHEARGHEDRALDAVRRAAQAGDPWNQAMLASHLRFGQEAPGDPAQAEPLLVAAAHGGDAWAARRLAFDRMEAGEWSEAKAWLLDPARRADIESLLAFATLHEEARPGLEADPERAITIYRSLGSEGVAEAHRRLADMAMQGRGMEKDLDEARALLEGDAEKGDSESQAMLGFALLRGQLGAVDEAGARPWLERAIEAGHEGAISDYGYWLYYSRDTAEARDQARALWERGRAQGFMGPSNNLAWVLCTASNATERDPALGLRIALEMDEAHDLDAGQVDTVAACHAASGDFESAVRTQQRAVDQLAATVAAAGDDATREALQADHKGLHERLVAYRAGQPYVEQAP